VRCFDRANLCRLRGQGPRAEASVARRLRRVRREQRCTKGCRPACRRPRLVVDEALQRRAEAGPRQLPAELAAFVSGRMQLIFSVERRCPALDVLHVEFLALNFNDTSGIPNLPF